MAVNAILTTYPGAMMSPQDFAIMVEKISSQQTGILYGCEASSTGGSTVNVAAGWVLIKGRLIQIEAGSIAITLPTSSATRYLYVKVDLSNSDIPCSVIVENSARTDSTDFNITDGEAYCLLATLAVNSSGIASVTNVGVITSTQSAINELENTDAKLAGSIATIETSPATANHSVGTYLVYNGQLYKVTTAITAGQTLTVGSNISAVSVGDVIGSGTLSTTAQSLIPAVNELNGKASPTRGTDISIANANISTLERGHVFRYGNVVVVGLTFTVSTAITGNTDVLFSGLPKAYNYSVRFRCPYVSTVNKVPLRLAVTTDGTIINQYTNGGIPADQYECQFTYICQ